MRTDAAATSAPERPAGGPYPTARPGGGPQPYDFRRPTKLSREHVRALQIVLETFARQWSTLLTSSLRATTQVSLVSIEQETYDEYVAGLPSPTVVNVLAVDPLPGAGILQFSLPAAMLSVDHMLGGPGAAEQPQRPLSDIEASLLRALVDRVLGELRYAFEGLVRIEPSVASVEYSPQFAQAAAASDVMMVARFDLRIGAHESPATLCLPFAALLPLLEAALGHGGVSEREQAARETARRALEAGLAGVPVEVSVRFEPVTVTPRTLVGLQPGDVLPLGHHVAAPLRVTAADVTFAHAVPGAQGRRLACLVVPDPDSHEENRP